MKKQEFSREEIIKMIDYLLQKPDVLLDAILNEMTDLDAESLLEIAEEGNANEIYNSK